MVEIMWSDIIKSKWNNFVVKKNTKQNLLYSLLSLTKEQETLCDNFYEKNINNKQEKIKKISLNQLQELKEKWITTELFLDYLYQKHGILLHGSTDEIEWNTLKSRNNKIFATDKASVAILKSIYSNKGVNLEYPDQIDEKNPLYLKIHTQKNWDLISNEQWNICLIKNNNWFKKNPNRSWEYIKDQQETEFSIIIETEKSDFKYPVQVINDYRPKNN